MTRVTLIHGDVLDRCGELEEGSFDAVLCDPPYGLSFMGRRWDHGVPSAETWAAVLRLLKPGAPLIAFGGTRTYHRLAVAVEDAGFEIRDSLLCGAWTYGSGFPKSLDIGKAIDRARDDNPDIVRLTSRLADLADAAGISRADVDAHMGTSDMGGWWLSRLAHRCACPSVENWVRLREFIPGARELDAEVWRLNDRKGEPGEAWWRREVVGTRMVNGAEGSAGGYANGLASIRGLSGGVREVDVTAPATPAAETWEGYGTSLKPAWEPAVLAMAPLSGTFAENALAHGVAGLNVDGGRVASGGDRAAKCASVVGLDSNRNGAAYGEWPGERTDSYSPAGRYPSNLLLCHHPQCREVGTRKVRETGPTESSLTALGVMNDDGWKPTRVKHAGFADPDGTETVTAWECSPECLVAGLDRQSGELSSGTMRAGQRRKLSRGEGGYKGSFPDEATRTDTPGDTGGASRFYFQASFDGADFLMYHAKAASSERRIGMPPGELCRHPTLKPISLMAYLAKLLLPPERPDGAPRRLLVPFAGAGSEIIGACRAGWEEVVGIELEAEHVAWARMRVEGDAPLFNVVTVESEEGDTE